MKNRITRTYAALLLALALALLYSAFRIPHSALAQDAGRRREPGIVFSRGCFIELTAGGTVSAGDALYLDSTGKAQRLDSTNAANAVGVADNAGVSGDTVRVQFCGIATVTADAAVSINDKVGGTSLVTAGRLRAVSNTFTNGSGATTVVMGTTNPVADNPASRVLGRALTAAAGAGNTFTVLILLQ